MASPSGYPEHVGRALLEAMEGAGPAKAVRRVTVEVSADTGEPTLRGIPDTNKALDWPDDYGSSINMPGDDLRQDLLKQRMMRERWPPTATVFAPEDRKAPEPALGDEFRERVQRIALTKRHEFWGKVEVDCRGYGLVMAAGGAGAAIVAAGLASWPASMAALGVIVLGLALLFPCSMLAAWRCAEIKARLDDVDGSFAAYARKPMQEAQRR